VLASELFFPESVPELLDLIQHQPGAALYAGGTEILRGQSEPYARLPRELISMAGLPELRQISLTERFVEIGAAVTMAEILELRENALPELFSLAVRGIGNPAIRSLATVGGNLATRSRFMDTWPALACLDALVELRRATGSRWINVNRLAGPDGLPDFPQGELLARVRIPLERWDYAVLRKVGVKDYPAKETAVFALASRSEKGILSEFRLAFAGERALRLRDIEGSLVGRRLPLEPRQLASFAAAYREAAAELPPRLRLQFGCLVDAALELLAR
jgi:CO/xanthine dehydrogenase FAD-binding subunit